MIEQNVQQARYLADLITAHSDLELLAPVPLNTVCGIEGLIWKDLRATFGTRLAGLDATPSQLPNSLLLREILSNLSEGSRSTRCF
jgi:hypothetical protein